MSELQATVEFSIELHKFYNVDLFQRGFYQIRCELRSAPKLSAKTEVSLPHQVKSEDTTLPACIINGVAVSKTFQILYRNEEIVLDDVIHYRVHIVLDSAKIQETINSADFEVDVGLWFSEDGYGMEQHESLECVSSRLLELDFVSSRGVHYSFPVLFDYFHLSAVSLTVHGVLVSVHQPYLRSPRQGNKRKGRNSANLTMSTMETVLFGQNQLNVKYGTIRTRLAIASTIYQEVCLLLLQSLEGLQSSLDHLCRTLPSTSAKPAIKMVDVRSRLLALSASAELLDNEDDFLQKANSDISQLCAENILLWNKYLELFTLVEEVRRHLAEIHHNHRLRRFSEGFFTMRNPRKSLLCCLDAKHQHHLTVSEAVRKSEYFQSLPNLQIHCKELDGTPSTLPIIFEDTYCDGLPKRHSTCDNIRLYPGCLLVPSGDGTDKPQDLILGPGEDTLNNDLIPNSTCSKETKENDKNRRKKISLPSKLGRTRTTREIGSQEFKEKYMIPRKSSLDSGLRSPGADNRFNLRSRFRNSKQDKQRRNSRDLKSSPSGPSLKGSSGFSHLECCSEVPYNLQEEPDDPDLDTRCPLILEDNFSGKQRTQDNFAGKPKIQGTPDTSCGNHRTKKSLDNLGGNSRTQNNFCGNHRIPKIQDNLGGNSRTHDNVSASHRTQAAHDNNMTQDEEESSISERSGYVSNTTPSSDYDVSSPDSGRIQQRTSGNKSTYCDLKSNSGDVKSNFSDHRRSNSCEVESYSSDIRSSASDLRSDKLRQDLSRPSPSHRVKEANSAQSLGSLREDVASPSIGLLRTDDGSSGVKRDPLEADMVSSRRELRRNSSLEGQQYVIDEEMEGHALDEEMKGHALDEVDSSMSGCNGGDGIGTSRLRRFLQDDASLGSPGLVLKGFRSRSEEPPVEKSLELRRPRHRSENLNENAAENPTSSCQKSQQTSSRPRAKSVLPPIQFRDNPKKNKQRESKDLKTCESRDNCSFKELKSVPCQTTRISDGKTADVRYLVGDVNEPVDDVPEPVVLSFVKPEDRTESKDQDRSYSFKREQKQRKADSLDQNGGCEKLLDLNRMSRSNTIAFISPSEGEKADFRARTGTEKPLTDTSTRKQQNPETALSQRLSSSLQFIDRNTVDSVYISRKESEGDVLEHTPVINQPVLALESSNLGFTCCDWLPNHISLQNNKLLKKIEIIIGPVPLMFVKARENFKRTTGFPGALYSDLQFRYSTPYFTQSPDSSSHTACHLVVCVHGLDGNSADLRLVKTYLEIALPSANLEFLMSEINQSDTFSSLEDMTDKLVNEISYHMKSVPRSIKRISFIGHSLGCILIRSAITRPELSKHSNKFYTFLSLSGPHLGTLYNTSGLVNAGLWMIQKWKKAGSLQQLTMKDSGDIRSTFLYKLSKKSNLELFKHVLLAGSSQDKYVPIHSARIELCKSAIKDSSVNGSAYKEMVHNILAPVVQADTELIRYDIQHALPNNTNSLIGRAAHIAVLDSELFIEKFLVIAALKYFQ